MRIMVHGHAIEVRPAPGDKLYQVREEVMRKAGLSGDLWELCDDRGNRLDPNAFVDLEASYRITGSGGYWR